MIQKNILLEKNYDDMMTSIVQKNSRASDKTVFRNIP